MSVNKIKLRREPKAVTRAYSEIDPDAPGYAFCVLVDGQLVKNPFGNTQWMIAPQAYFLEARINQCRQPFERDILAHYNLATEPTDTIQVVAPGPNGVKRFSRLDPECFTIVVNKAIEVTGIRKDVWMVADSNAYRFKNTKCSWFGYGLKHYWDIACFDSGFLLEHYPDVPHTFEHGPLMGVQGNAMPYPGVLRGGCTISCQAMQLAYWLGAKHIRLCGVDLSQDKYFDGTSSGVEKRNGEWTWMLDRFKAFTQWLIEHGITVTSLTNTKLEVPIEQ